MKNMMKKRLHSETAISNSANNNSWGIELAATRGLSILFTELSTKSIGFEGLGFFTLTYTLIGSVSF